MVVIAVSIDQGRDETVRKLIKDYAERKKLTFLNLIDSESEVAAQYGVRGLPMNFFINPQGKIVAFATGYREWDSKQGHMMIEQLLSSYR